ncbi:MAG: hypothetical protein Q4F38_03490 [Akkermansia sp.]|nr:hypothetical protein [Akkermansia sp.]
MSTQHTSQQQDTGSHAISTQHTPDTDNLRTILHDTAAHAAQTARQKAAVSTGWQKWLWLAAMVLAAAAAWFTTSCNSLNHEQIRAAHSLYHLVSNTPCPLSK